jgi:hypothetical protein
MLRVELPQGDRPGVQQEKALQPPLPVAGQDLLKTPG